MAGRVTCSTVPPSRWDAASTRGLYLSATYGAFWTNKVGATDTMAFGISNLEAQTMDP